MAQPGLIQWGNMLSVYAIVDVVEIALQQKHSQVTGKSGISIFLHTKTSFSWSEGDVEDSSSRCSISSPSSSSSLGCLVTHKQYAWNGMIVSYGWVVLT